jgi:glycosyltransferase involved in cell wall biosynthesis
MAAGKPVVASNLPGPNEVVDHGITGLLSTPGDSRSLVKAFFELLTNEKAAKSMGLRGKSKAMDYTWDRVAVRFLDIYDRALKCE